MDNEKRESSVVRESAVERAQRVKSEGQVERVVSVQGSDGWQVMVVRRKESRKQAVQRRMLVHAAIEWPFSGVRRR